MLHHKTIKKVISIIMFLTFICSNPAYGVPSSRSLFKNKKVDYQKLSAQSEEFLQKKKVIFKDVDKRAEKHKKQARRVLTTHLKDLSRIHIPSELGKVIEVHQAPLDKPRLIVHIQDLHTNPEAQFNLAKILELLIKDYNLAIVCSEGADGEVDTSSVSSFPDYDVREKVARLFVNSGELTGEEYLSITKYPEISVWGIEDRDLYFKNIIEFNKIMKFNPSSQVFISQTKKVLEELKPKIYSRELLELDKLETDYENKKIETDKYLKELLRYIQRFNITTSHYKNITLLIEAAQQEQKIDQQKIMQESQNLLLNLQAELSRKGLQAEMDSLMVKAQLFKDQKLSPFSFYSYLRDLALRHLYEYPVSDLEKYPHLSDFIDYLTKVNSLDSTKLFNEMEDFSYEVKQNLAKTPEQKTLIKALRNIKFLEDFFNLRISNEELDYYLQNKESHKVGWFKSAITNLTDKAGLKGRTNYIDFNPDLIDTHLDEIEDFYKIVKARDVAMVDNAISEIEKRDAKVAALISGGFHTKGITRLLREKGFSYIVVSPYSSTDIDEENYRYLLSGKRKPLDEIMKDYDFTETIKELNASLRVPLVADQDMVINWNSNSKLVEEVGPIEDALPRMWAALIAARPEEVNRWNPDKNPIIDAIVRKNPKTGEFFFAVRGKYQRRTKTTFFKLSPDGIFTVAENKDFYAPGNTEVAFEFSKGAGVALAVIAGAISKGSPLDLLKYLVKNGYFEGKTISMDEIRKVRIDPEAGKPYADSVIYNEINSLIALGLLERTKRGNYTLTKKLTLEQIETINESAKDIVDRRGREGGRLGLDRWTLTDLGKDVLARIKDVIDENGNLSIQRRGASDRFAAWDKWINQVPSRNDLNLDMFRDYDYRSAGPVLEPSIVFRFGVVWASMALEKARKAGITNRKVLIARDARKIEPELVEALISALRYMGLDVVYIAADGPNAVSSYSWATQEHKPLMSIFITASHLSRPKDVIVRGFKVAMMDRKGGSLQSMTSKEIKKISKDAMLHLIENPGSIYKMESSQKGKFEISNIDENCVRMCSLVGEVAAAGGSLYELAREIEASDFPVDVLTKWETVIGHNRPLRGMKVVVEGAHTPSGQLAADTFERLGAEVVLLHGDVQEIEGEHNADPSKDVNLAQLKEAMNKEDADFGLAFDLDGDRGAIVVPDPISETGFRTLPPDNIMVAILPYIINKLGYAPALLGRNVVVIRDVLGTFGVNDMAKRLGVEAVQTDAGYVFLKAKRQGLLKAGYVVPIYGERSGHAWLDVTGEFENPIAVTVLFATMVKEAKYRDDGTTGSSNPFLEAFTEQTIPYRQSTRFQPLFHSKFLLELSTHPKNYTGWSYDPQSPAPPPQTIIALGRDEAIRRLKDEFAVGKVYATPAGELKVREFNTYQDPPDEGGLYRFADIVFELDGQFAGRFVFRASSNDPTFVCSFETPVWDGEDYASSTVRDRYISVGGVVLDWLENSKIARVTGEDIEYPNKAETEPIIHEYRVKMSVVDPNRRIYNFLAAKAKEIIAGQERPGLALLEAFTVSASDEGVVINIGDGFQSTIAIPTDDIRVSPFLRSPVIVEMLLRGLIIKNLVSGRVVSLNDAETWDVLYQIVDNVEADLAVGGRARFRSLVAELTDRRQLELAVDAELEKLGELSAVDRIVWCGMGGSGVAGDVLKGMVEALGVSSDIEVVVVKEFEIPQYILDEDDGQNTLYILSSFSGKTAETLKMGQMLQHEGKDKVIAMCSGKMDDSPIGRLAEDNGWSFISIVDRGQLAQPREAYILTVAKVRRILEGILRAKGMADDSVAMGNILDRISIHWDRFEASSRKIARDIYTKGKIPVLIVEDSSLSMAIATRIKQQFAECPFMPVLVFTVEEAQAIDWSAYPDKFYFCNLSRRRLSGLPLMNVDLYARIARLLGKSKGELTITDVVYGVEALFGTLTAYNMSILRGIEPMIVPLITGDGETVMPYYKASKTKAVQDFDAAYSRGEFLAADDNKVLRLAQQGKIVDIITTTEQLTMAEELQAKIKEQGSIAIISVIPEANHNENNFWPRYWGYRTTADDIVYVLVNKGLSAPEWWKKTAIYFLHPSGVMLYRLHEEVVEESLAVKSQKNIIRDISKLGDRTVTVRGKEVKSNIVLFHGEDVVDNIEGFKKALEQLPENQTPVVLAEDAAQKNFILDNVKDRFYYILTLEEIGLKVSNFNIIMNEEGYGIKGIPHLRFIPLSQSILKKYPELEELV